MKWHVFNPENDLALACFSPYFIPPCSARQMAEDLSALPAWWASSGDAVCVARPGDTRRWAEANASWLPPLEWADGGCLPPGAEVVPWGWNPMLVRRLVLAGVSPDLLPDEGMLRRFREEGSRRRAVELLAWLRGTDSAVGRKWGDRLCGESFFCTDEAGIARLLDCCPEAILKAPWSGSGRGLRLGRGGYRPPLSGWCRRVLREQGGVVVEPLYNKVYDFAMEFHSDGQGGVTYEGLSRFFTTVRGTYAGNRVVSEEEHIRWLTSFVPYALWETLRDDLTLYFSHVLDGGYRGPFGVDMMLCRREGHETLFLHPCVEVNLRRTMGHVAASLARFLAPGAEARFVIDYCAEAGSLQADQERKIREMPWQMAGGKLSAGYLPLTPVIPSSCYRAALWVVPSSPAKALPSPVG